MVKSVHQPGRGWTRWRAATTDDNCIVRCIVVNGANLLKKTKSPMKRRGKDSGSQWPEGRAIYSPWLPFEGKLW